MTRAPITLQITVQRDSAQHHVLLSGRLDAHQVPEFLAAAESAAPSTILNLAGVTFIDSSGLAALVRLVRAAQGTRQHIEITHVQDSVRLALEITGLYGLLPIRPAT